MLVYVDISPLAEPHKTRRSVAAGAATAAQNTVMKKSGVLTGCWNTVSNQRTASCLINEPENAPRYIFSTKEYLPAAGLYLYQYRAYDPIADRWTQRDPIDYQDSVNLYQFCGNSPVNATDPNGCVIWNQLFRGLGGVATGVGMFAGACALAGTTGLTLVGGLAGAGLAAGGMATIGASASVVAGAVADIKMDFPATPGEVVAAGVKAAVTASDVGNTHPTAAAILNTLSDGLGLAIDDLLSCHVATVCNTIANMCEAGTTLSGIATIDESGKNLSQGLKKQEKRDNQNK